MSDAEIKQALVRIRAEVDAVIASIDKDISDHENIKAVILDYFHLSDEDFTSANRTQKTRVLPRDFYYLYVKSLLGISFMRAGDHVGCRNHATVSHGVANIINWMEYKDKEIISHFEYLNLVFESRGYDISLVFKFIEEWKDKNRHSLKALRCS